MSTGLISDLLNIQPQTSTPAGSMQVKMLPREYISEQQYERYLELFRQGRKAIDEHSPTVTELALSILNRIFQDIDRDCRQCEFEALSPDEQLAELKRAEESRQAWRQYIASLKEMINPSAAQE